MLQKNRVRNKIEQYIIATPRWILRIVLLVFLLFFVFGILRNCQGNIDQPPPDQAPWVVQTYLHIPNNHGTFDKVPDRYYLGKEYSEIDGVPSLNGYWDFDGSSYNYHEETIQFPASKYGQIDVYLRN